MAAKSKNGAAEIINVLREDGLGSARSMKIPMIRSSAPMNALISQALILGPKQKHHPN
jgi:hypothetical protein